MFILLKSKFSKTFYVGAMCLILACVTGLAEMVLYGGKLDTEGVVQESFFLPLTFILIASGVFFLILSFLKKK